MQKRIVVPILLLMILLCGCKNTPNLSHAVAYNHLTDSQIAKTKYSAYAYNITKSESGYYSYSKNFIYYTDESSMETTPLCAKPNCMHKSDLCNAYLGAIYSIVYNDGYLYYNKNGSMEQEYLGTQFYRMTPDGTQKEKLVYFENIVMDWTIHRGYLYYVSIDYQLSEAGSTVASTTSDAYVYRLSVKDFNAKPELVYRDSEIKFEPTVSGVIGFGENLYFMSTGQIDEDIDSFVMKSIKLNISDFSCEEMKVSDGRILVYPNLLGDSLVFQCEKNKDGQIEYYSTDFNGDNPKLIMAVDEFERAFADGKYLYVDNKLSFSIANPDYDKIEQIRRFKVYDKNINLIDEVYFDGASACSWEFLPVDDKVFLFVGKASDESAVVFSYDKSQLGNIHGAWEKSIHYNASDNTENENAPGALSDSAPHGSDTLVSLWQKAKNKEYGVKDSFQSDGAEAEGGFSVRLMWEQDGGTFTAYFPFMEFQNEVKAKEYINTNPYALQKDNVVVNIGVESVPQEVYDMLSSILNGTPIEPIDSKDFSGENFVFE